MHLDFYPFTMANKHLFSNLLTLPFYFIISMRLNAKADQNYLLSPKNTKNAHSPIIKTNPIDMMPIMSLRDFRSASKSKGKLKLHVFNNKKPEK